MYHTAARELTMRLKSEQTLHDWLQQADATMRQYLAWTEKQPTATLREREERTLAVQQSLLGRALEENLVPDVHPRTARA